MAKASATDRYYRIPADNRDLNYGRYFVEGEPEVSNFDDYTSHNSTRLTIPEVKELLLTVPFVREQLGA